MSSGETLSSHRAIEESLPAAGPGSTLLVAGDTTRLARLIRIAESHHVPVRRVPRKQLRALAPDAHDCALQLARSDREQRNVRLEDVLADPARSPLLVLVLDHVTDPHNYGAILRSADQFGVDAVVVPGRRAAPLSAAAVQASAGTAAHVPVVTVPNVAAAVESLKRAEVWVYAAEMAGDPIHTASLTGRVAIVMGSEGKGISRLIGERADAHLRIPMQGHADSLNVSVACGVMLYEVRRQQGWLDGR